MVDSPLCVVISSRTLGFAPVDPTAAARIVIESASCDEASSITSDEPPSAVETGTIAVVVAPPASPRSAGIDGGEASANGAGTGEPFIRS